MFISTNCDHPVLFEVKIGRNAVEKSINILIYFFILKMQRFLYAYLPLFLKGRHRWEFDLLPFPGTLSRPEKEYLYVCVFVMYVNKFILYSLKCQFLAEWCVCKKVCFENDVLRKIYLKRHFICRSYLVCGMCEIRMIWDSPRKFKIVLLDLNCSRTQRKVSVETFINTALVYYFHYSSKNV